MSRHERSELRRLQPARQAGEERTTVTEEDQRAIVARAARVRSQSAALRAATRRARAEADDASADRASRRTERLIEQEDAGFHAAVERARLAAASCT
jgi:hypothetical protein